MNTSLPVIALALFGAIITGSLFSSFDPAFTYMNPSLIIVLWYVSQLRTREAVFSAIITGLVLDILFSNAVGTHVFIWVALTLTVTFLFTRLFIHLSIASFAGLNLLSFVLLEFFMFILTTLKSMFGLLPSSPTLGAGDIQTFFIGTILHLILAVVLLLLFRFVRKLLAPITIIRHI